MSDHLNRKSAIINLLALPLAAAGVATTLGPASAAATLDPKAVKYQATPHNGRDCDDCILYIPAKSDPEHGIGTCKQVKGAINPHGWCQIWTPKHH